MTQPVERAVPSPVGTLRLVANDAGLVGVYFPSHRRAPVIDAVSAPHHPVLNLAAAELAEFFAGARRTFTTPLAPSGTAFERSVWALLTTIPYGETRSYGALAAELGRPTAARAVGAANGRNPLSLFVPCHRVIGADGSLTGYAGGTEAKRWLLAHEAANAPQFPVPAATGKGSRPGVPSRA